RRRRASAGPARGGAHLRVFRPPRRRSHGGDPARDGRGALLRLHARRHAADRAPWLRRRVLSPRRHHLRVAARGDARLSGGTLAQYGASRDGRPAVIALIALALLGAAADESKYPGPLK